jgi:hypothetical protein
MTLSRRRPSKVSATARKWLREDEMTQQWQCNSWTAVHDRMPGKAPALRVAGSCTFPSTGYSASLKRHEPQGINPWELMLDLVVTPPDIDQPAVTEIAVEYVEETDYAYKTVSIIGYESGIPVQDVS